MSALLSAAPIGIVVLSMTVWRWGAVSAGLLGLAATLVIAVAGFGFRSARSPGRSISTKSVRSA